MQACFILTLQLVAPKRKKLKEAEEDLELQMSHLKEKRTVLAKVEGILKALYDDLELKSTKKKVYTSTTKSQNDSCVQ